MTSEVLKRLYASSGIEVILDTIELSCPAWAESIYLVQGYRNETLTLENSLVVEFIAAPIGISLPKRANDAQQTINFAIDNVVGEAQRRLDDAFAAAAQITLVFRRYVSTDRSGPSENPFRATVLSGQITEATVQLEAGFFDLLDYAWPRDLYTAKFAPGIKYL